MNGKLSIILVLGLILNGCSGPSNFPSPSANRVQVCNFIQGGVNVAGFYYGEVGATRQGCLPCAQAKTSEEIFICTGKK